MKVCTDACLFGGWVASKIDIAPHQNILDIGTGTGLLSLMIAQAIPSDKSIHAIEIEQNAFEEASNNFQMSPWNHQIHNHRVSLQDFTSNIEFDIIISNPPFYEGDLKSPSSAKNLASHSEALSWNDLSANVNRLLSSDGNFYVLIPASRAYTMQKLAEKENMHLLNETLVFHHNESKIPFRTIMHFGRCKAEEISRERIYIKEDQEKYSKAFVDLLKDYYLHF